MLRNLYLDSVYYLPKQSRGLELALLLIELELDPNQSFLCLILFDRVFMTYSKVHLIGYGPLRNPE
jgi:hypothetical protein